MTSLYGDVYLLAVASSIARSRLESTMSMDCAVALSPPTAVATRSATPEVLYVIVFMERST